MGTGCLGMAARRADTGSNHCPGAQGPVRTGTGETGGKDYVHCQTRKIGRNKGDRKKENGEEKNSGKEIITGAEKGAKKVAGSTRRHREGLRHHHVKQQQHGRERRDAQREPVAENPVELRR